MAAGNGGEEADPQRFGEEAAAVFDGEIVVAADLDVVPVPRCDDVPPTSRSSR